VEKLTRIIGSLCNKSHIGKWCAKRIIPIVTTVLKLLVSHENPARVCQALKMCSSALEVSNGEMTDALVLLRDTELEMEVGGGLKCDVCQAIIQYVIDHLQGEATQQKIQDLITKACGQIPFARNVCVQMIAPVIAKITADIINKLDAPQVCQSIQICSAPAMEIVH